ncbi:MAG TPA: TPM domain-containing protein [Alphaproteobacteria bacterium]|nr:TPM domain-containing protein [Alphaproteobacteria bacterium]
MRRLSSVARAVVAAALLIAAIGFLPASAATPKFPSFTGTVVDDANLLSASTRAKLTQTLDAFQRASGNQVVVATVKTLQGYPIEDYGYQLGRAWAVGQKGKDNGVILLVASDERKVRIEVGYGLEGDLTDAQSKLIIERDILPAFRRGDFNGGVLAGTADILRALGGTAAAGASGSVRPSQAEGFVHSVQNDPAQLAIFLISMLVFIGFGFLRAHGFYGPVYPRPHGIWRRGSGGVFPIGGGFPGSGGGFGGGGFGGGGGGSFGGGGASGGW